MDRQQLFAELFVYGGLQLVLQALAGWPGEDIVLTHFGAHAPGIVTSTEIQHLRNSKNQARINYLFESQGGRTWTGSMLNFSQKGLGKNAVITVAYAPVLPMIATIADLSSPGDDRYAGPIALSWLAVILGIIGFSARHARAPKS